MSTSPQNFSSDPASLGGAAEMAPGLAPSEPADWKREVNERIAAHRARRGKVTEAQATLPLEVDQPPVRSRARVAARVAERYAKAPAYSAVLAQQAKAGNADEDQDQVEDQVGDKRSDAVQAHLTGFLPDLQASERPTSERLTSERLTSERPTSERNSSEFAEHKNAAAKVGAVGIEWASGLISVSGLVKDAEQPDAKQMSDATESIAADIDTAVEWIPGNLIEFPRVLVAARKARPRLAEGPLRQDATLDTDPEQSQLRIFEVEQQAISTSAEAEPVTTEWSSIRLNARPQESANADSHSNLMDKPLQSAPLSQRLMAGVVDGALVALAFLAFVAVFVACTAHPPGGRPALIAAACTLVALFLLYQCLFFTYSEATPGMRYARIALCTFDDENPTRRQMRARIGALLLSACPLALGFAWAWFDEDRLGWHDRMTKTYQRSCR